MIQPVGNLDDERLWQHLKAGDRNGFNELFCKYYSQLFYYGIKIYPDQDIVKESIQEVFLRIWEKKSGLSDMENVKSYLMVALRRMVLLQKESAKFALKVQLEDVDNQMFFFVENEFEKHEEISDEIRKFLLESINSLTKKQSELILLFFLS